MVIVEGCPGSTDDRVLCYRCSGWWHKLSDDKVTKAVNNGTLDPTKLCDPLAEKVHRAYEQIANNFERR